MNPEKNELSENAKGGTEIMMEALYKKLPSDLLNKFQIIPSRVRELQKDKIRVLYCHDLPEDPESHHLANGGWNKFNRIVFVSHWQRDMYIVKYNIPFSKTAVIHNAIEPINCDVDKPTDKIRVIYHTTPHRGLELLVPVFEKLTEKYSNIHLDVFSSFKIYGWEKRDEPYQKLFDRIKNNSQMTYHGYRPNSEVREALAKSHIFAYPSIWMETSCMALIEAMSAGCICVHPNFGALPETAANWTYMYNMHEEPNAHASTFYGMMDAAISSISSLYSKEHQVNFKAQQSYINLHYGWDLRKLHWISFLESIADEKIIPIDERVLTFKTG